ncbi:hypothetical protein [Priestia aryabhattai]
MKAFYKIMMGLCLTLSLTGCFGENYDFSPPTVTISPTVNDIVNLELKEANLDWNGNDNKPYKKETKNILKLGEKQQSLAVGAGTEGNIQFDSEDFSVGGLTISVLNNDEKKKLKLNQDDRTFKFPKQKGRYVIVVDLYTDQGKAQYVGNINVK